MLKFLLLSLCLSNLIACGQQKSTPTKPGPESFQSKFVRLVKDTSVMMLIEDVRAAFGELYVESDSLLLDKPAQTVTAYGIRKLVFSGRTLGTADYGPVVKYTKGAGRLVTE